VDFLQLYFQGGGGTVDLNELEGWFQERPKWIQDAARRLAQNGTLNDEDFADFFAICNAEATGQKVDFDGLPAGTLGVVDATRPLRLKSIANVQGINALSPSKPLEFDEAPLCIVYGRNGAGKSGYVRLLKHACGDKRPGDLLGNIFVAGIQHQEAKFTFIEDTQTKTSLWSGKPLPELKGVEIYDTACGLVYVNDENEVAFEPWLLRLFTQLTNACTALSQRIQEQISGHVSKKPKFPDEFATSSAAKWYTNLTATTSSEDVDEHTAWKTEHNSELIDINKRLSEVNPTAKATALRRQKTLVLELKADLKKYYDGLSNDCCNAHLQERADAEAKRKAADEDADKVFKKASLTGVGTDSWRLLWGAARRYSEEHAYKTKLFPNIAADARCVLCQRELDQESRDRFASFETFVKGELQRLAVEAEQNLQKSLESFAMAVSGETLAIKLEASGITDTSVKEMMTNFITSLNERKQTCLNAISMTEIPERPTKRLLINLAQFARKYAAQARIYDKDAVSDNRPQLEQKSKELSARKWLNQQRKAIDAEILRLIVIQRLQKADRLTNTQALSKRKSILADELITNAYIQRFDDELKRFKAAGINVEIKKTRTQVGRVYHRISMKNVMKDVKTSEILSEGEFRIISLAAFLADTEGQGTKTPFVFDDPISSLDHVYEEAMASRLAELSQTRQVIVFTHRLSLVGYLKKYADKRNIIIELRCLSRYTTGEITELPIDLKRTDRAVNFLANERLAAAKKAFAQGDAAYEIEAKGLCGDIRTLIERIVEMDLLNEVIRRFSAEINTKGKIYSLSKISPEDCKFIDDYMTKYSQYEHSQPEEAPVGLPGPDEIATDLEEISFFIKNIRKRNEK
jgi:ABC-type phosphate/phosphonate transport system ATPase subunit